MPRTRADRANVTPEDIRTRAALCHLAAVTGFVLPGFAVAGPYLAWRRMGSDGPFVDAHGRAAVEVNLAFFALEAVLFALAGAATLWYPRPTLVTGLFATIFAVALAHVGAIGYGSYRAHEGRDVDLAFRVPVLRG